MAPGLIGIILGLCPIYQTTICLLTKSTSIRSTNPLNCCFSFNRTSLSIARAAIRPIPNGLLIPDRAPSHPVRLPEPTASFGLHSPEKPKRPGSGRLGPMNRQTNPRSWTDPLAPLTTRPVHPYSSSQRKRAFEVPIPRADPADCRGSHRPSASSGPTPGGSPERSAGRSRAPSVVAIHGPSP
jgi:hypothetical protein